MGKEWKDDDVKWNDAFEKAEKQHKRDVAEKLAQQARDEARKRREREKRETETLDHEDSHEDIHEESPHEENHEDTSHEEQAHDEHKETEHSHKAHHAKKAPHKEESLARQASWDEVRDRLNRLSVAHLKRSLA